MTDDSFIVESEESIDYKEYLFKIYNFRFVFIISIALALALAFIYNRYATPIYKASTTILITSDAQSGTKGSADMMQGFGLFSGKQNIENEMVILRSREIIGTALRRMNSTVSYFAEYSFVEKEIYNSAPFIVEQDTAGEIPASVKFFVSFIGKNSFLLKTDKEETGKEYTLCDTIRYADFKFLLKPNQRIKQLNYANQNYAFVFNSINTLIPSYQNTMTIEPVNDNASIISISVSGSNRQRIVDYLNSLTKVYIEKKLQKKNQFAELTIQFINNQLNDITDSLQNSEQKLQNFKTSNMVTDLSSQAEGLYSQIQELSGQKAVLLVNEKYYKYLKDYVQKNSDIKNVIVPSSMGIVDGQLNTQISELIQLYANLNSSFDKDKSKNLYIKTLQTQITNLKKSILENIDQSVNLSRISKQDLDERIAKIETEINKLPATERKLISIERQFKLSDAIYTFLLQKRAEAQIAKAANIAGIDIIDYADISYVSQTYPKKGTSFNIALILGVLIPVVILVLNEILNDKILSKTDVAKLTKAPILGHILHNKYDEAVVLSNYPKSPISESFRSVRTNLNFFCNKSSQQTILITSSLSGEGKSFNAINIASAFAIFGKKTIILGFDLRKPRLFKDFGLKNETGITNYLINEAELNEIIQNTTVPNLQIITSGTVPPNPAELIASTKTKEFIEELKTRYDCIIIDTSPVGIVTDAYLLTSFADICVYVVRQKYTPKKVFSSVIESFTQNDIKNVAILINDVALENISHYGYGYEYGYGYGYKDGYYEDTPQKGKLGKRILSFFKNKNE